MFVMTFLTIMWVFQGTIFYKTDGDYPAPSFFAVNNVTGDVQVKQDLRHDNLQLGSYTVCTK